MIFFVCRPCVCVCLCIAYNSRSAQSDGKLNAERESRRALKVGKLFRIEAASHPLLVWLSLSLARARTLRFPNRAHSLCRALCVCVCARAPLRPQSTGGMELMCARALGLRMAATNGISGTQKQLEWRSATSDRNCPKEKSAAPENGGEDFLSARIVCAIHRALARRKLRNADRTDNDSIAKQAATNHRG